MLIKDVYEEYINFTPLSKRTKTMYIYCFENFWLKKIGCLDLSNLTYTVIQSCFNELVKIYNYNTIRIYRSSIMKLLEIAEIKDNITYNWKYSLKYGKQTKIMEFDTDIKYQFFDLIKYLQKSRSKCAKSYETACWIGFFTGMRLGEVLALTVDDIDLKRNKIRVNKNLLDNGTISTTKTPNSIRSVYICNELKEILENYLKNITGKILLPDKNGNYIITYRVSSFISNFAKRRGYSIHFHSLRQIFTKNMLDNGANLENVRALLGHSSSFTTLTLYKRTTSIEQKDDIEKVFNKQNIREELEQYKKDLEHKP